MLNPGLSHADMAEVLKTLRNSHEIRVQLNLLNMAGHTVGTSTNFLTGQLLGDEHRFGVPHGPNKRILATLLDPRNALGVDTDSPDDGVLFADRMVEVRYGVRVPTLGRWVNFDVFTGTPTKLQRTDDVVDIEADDSSVLGMGATWKPLHIGKGTPKVTAIKKILTARTGMTRFAFPSNIKTKLPHHMSLGRNSHPLAAADRIAKSMDMQLYRRGDNVVVLRRLPNTPLYTFNTGPGGEIIEPVATSTEKGDFANVIEVLGRKPKGSKNRLRVVVTADRAHPLSPWRIGENGVPRRIVATIENDHFRHKAEMRKHGERILMDRLRMKTEVSYGILPNPIFEPGDLVRAITEDGDPVEHRMSTFTLPLAPEDDAAMTVGYFKSPPPRPRRIRRA